MEYLIAELDKAIRRQREILGNLETALAILTGKKLPKKIGFAHLPSNVIEMPKRRRRHMSAEARHQISLAQKRRWRRVKAEAASHKHPYGKQRRHA